MHKKTNRALRQAQGPIRAGSGSGLEIKKGGDYSPPLIFTNKRCYLTSQVSLVNSNSWKLWYLAFSLTSAI